MKPSAPVSASLTNRPERVTPLMRPVKVAPIAISEKMRDQAVDGFALGRHGAALGRGNLRRDFAERPAVASGRQAVVAELQRADQGAVDDEIGITADGRGEMGVAAQVEAEMAVVLRGIFRLGLAAQHHFVDERFAARRP